MVNSAVKDSSSGSIGYIGFSFLLHSSLVALLALAPSLRPIPPGTVEMTEIAVISESTPLGNTPEPVISELPPAPPSEPAAPTPAEVVKKEMAAVPPAAVVVKAKVKAPAPPLELPAKKITTPAPPPEPENSPEPETSDEESPVVAAIPVEPAREEPAPPEPESPAESAAYQEYQKSQADAESSSDTKETSADEMPLVAAEPPQESDDETAKTEAAAMASVRNESRAETLESAKPATAQPGGGMNGIPEGARLNTDLRQHPGNVPPVYPALARQNGWEGTVALSYNVSPEGRVENLKLTQSSGHQMLDREAYRAISRYRYLPGQQGKTYHPVTFRLTGPAQALPSRLRTSSASMR